MEDELDAVAKGDKIWHDVCSSCYSELEKLMSAIIKRGKETIRIDSGHTYMIGKYGPVVKVHSTEPQYLSVKKGIDLNKLRRGEYALEDIIENEAKPSVGLHKDKPVYIKAGKFGIYLEWNSQTQSLKHLKKPLDEITLEDVLEIVYDLDVKEGENGSGGCSGVLRVINSDASIRKGKGDYDNYIFYKNKKMKKPRFLKLDGFTGDYLKCELILLQEWFSNTYKVV